MDGYIPSLFFFVIFDSTRNIFNAYQKFKIPNFMTFVTYVLHAGWVYLFMYVLNMQMFGLGLSRSITEFCNAFVLILIVKYKGLFKNI